MENVEEISSPSSFRKGPLNCCVCAFVCDAAQNRLSTSPGSVKHCKGNLLISC